MIRMTKLQNRTNKVLSVVLAAAMAFLAQPQLTEVTMAETLLSMDDFQDIVSTYSVDDSILSYKEYVEAHPGTRPAGEIVITAADVVRYEEDGSAVNPVIYTDYEGIPGGGQSILTGEDALIEFEFTVPTEGYYDINLLYYPVAGKNSEIQRSIFIDGELPYEELSLLKFSRVWVNEYSEFKEDTNGIRVRNWASDNQGNNKKPSMLEAPEWQSTLVYDSNGYITTPLNVYLTKGDHTMSILSLREPMMIGSITLSNTGTLDNYATVKAAYDAMGATKTSGVNVRIEAENADRTSSQMLYPQQDQSSPAVYPSSPKMLLNNSIGGNSWRLAGQWLEWDFEVPTDGYYNLSMFVRQNFVRGINVSRKIYIDGEVPFSEFSAYEFGYAQKWREETLSDEAGTPYDVYLTKGSHTLRMEVVLGEMSDIIAEVQSCVQDLNAIYRKVICIIGVTPDKYRDYQITSCLPELEGELTAVQQKLRGALSKLEITAGRNSDKLTILRTMDDQLTELIKDQERFTEVISSYKVNVRACGNWITQVLGQPLQVDRIYVHSSDAKEKIENNTWWKRLCYEISRLYYSFIIDYNQIGNTIEDGDERECITLWVGTGRDQANVIRALIDESFTGNTDINVNVQLVDMNTLLRAELAGEGPDIAIQVANTNGIAGSVLNTGNDTPVNYGLRNAVLDLTMFDDLPEVLERFYPSALTGFSFDGAVYALPETQTFPVMFYRKDLIEDLGIDIPKTWDDVKVIMSVLEHNQMEFGMLPNEQTFAMLLYQNGGEYYTEGGLKSALDSDIAVSTFKEYCEFYTDYGLDKTTSVEERFRTGECPLVIADYTMYNTLEVSAPDIQGLWDFTLVPGTKMADGTVNHSVGCTGLASIIMADTEHPDACWEFLKWWTSAETQTLFDREMESLMGSAARVATANREAFSELPWPVTTYEALKEAFSYVKGIPQVPGGYYSWRNVNNAFYTVTTDTDTASPREELMDKVLYINDEINYKRIELKLPVAEE